MVSWEQFTQSVQEAEKLARPEDFDYLGLLSNQKSWVFGEQCSQTPKLPPAVNPCARYCAFMI